MNSRVLDTPFVSCVLIILTIGAGSLWYRSNADQLPPEIGDYNWNAHPNTMLIVVPSNYCGCGASPTTLTLQALDHNLDVIVVSDKPGTLLTDVEKMHSSAKRVTLFDKAGPELMARFCPTNNLGIARIKNNHIEEMALGTIPDDFFGKEGQV
ncbi:hypothetical protein EON83_21935 [bacterium]|nr:MAG: hypothetical protein EON83_21935 [bacterium]